MAPLVSKAAHAGVYERPDFDEKKFRELVLHVASRLEGDPTYGATKLNKVLFYADFFYYGEHGTPITGATYQKLRFGPAPRELLRIRDELIKSGDAALKVSRYLGSTQKRLVALRDPYLVVFSSDEIELVDEVIETLRSVPAGEVSRISHYHLGWQLAEEGEDIPYFTVFLSGAPLSADDVDRGQMLAKEHGLATA